jgi:FAD synthase
MVMSYGNNDFYKNESKSAEVHIYDRLFDDFYGSQIDIQIEGYIRAQSDFPNVQALIRQIHNDIQMAKARLPTHSPKPW